jgi:hypothetical protein
LNYFRRMAAGKRDNYKEWMAATRFLFKHGLSLDWIIAGCPRGMIRFVFEKRSRPVSSPTHAAQRSPEGCGHEGGAL